MSKGSSEDLLEEDKEPGINANEQECKLDDFHTTPDTSSSANTSSDSPEPAGVDVDTSKSSEESVLDSLSSSSGSSSYATDSDSEVKTEESSTRRKILVKTTSSKSHESRKPSSCQILRRVLYIMTIFAIRYYREICIAFLVVLSGLSSLKTGSMKIRVVPTPDPFFSETESLPYIQDNYKGEYVDLVINQIPFHPSFIFYYAPWDSESVAAKDVFLDIAKHFYHVENGLVKFYAVNCWWPYGECRQNYKNLSHYPIFVAHIGKQTGIIYSGPVRKELIIKFIKSLLKPVTRIDTEEELWRFRAQHDAIMLAYFNFSDPDSASAYDTYLQMALRKFEGDPFSQVGFGLFLNAELANKFFLSSSHAISLVLFNEIHTAKWQGGYHSQGLKGPVSQVAEWLVERTKRTPVTWAYRVRAGFANRAVALGPIDLYEDLTNGPVFLLITRRYFPSAYSPFYAQMKEVALDYFNCNKSGNVTKLRKFTHKINAEWLTLWKSLKKVCDTSNQKTPRCLLLKEQLHHWDVRKSLFRRESLASYENTSSALNFTGLSCLSEKAFKFIAIDPFDVPHFIQLGLSGLGYTDGNDPLAFIIDAENELILPFKSFNISKIAETIHEYTFARETGHFEDFTETSLLWDEDRHNSIHPESKKVDSKQSLIRRLTSDDLLKYMEGKEPFHEKTPMLLLFTASFCGFCGNAIAHMVALSRFLRENYNSRLNITLAKIDVFQNSLPIDLTPETIPSFVFFPAENRSDPRLYPTSQEINSKNLLRFLLSEMDSSTRVELSLSSPGCRNSFNMTISHSESLNNSCFKTATRENCLRVNKEYVSEQIQMILNKLRDENESFDHGHSSGYFSEELYFDDENEEVPLNSNQEFHSDSMKMWKNSLLDHLRSMKLSLDAS